MYGEWKGRKKNSTSKAESSFRYIIIPEEIVVEILSRLPLHYLLRFNCVSKRWRSLISNISAAKTGSPTVLTVSKSKAHSFSPQSIDQHQQEVQVKSIDVPWDVKNKYFDSFRILGSCNGLLLMNIDEDLFLWNPLSTFFKKVLAYFRLGDEDYSACSGLCYDSTNDEYKAVLALTRESPGYVGQFVVVGSFRSKSWTVVDIPYTTRSVNSGPIVNGNLHWFASKNDSGTHFLSPHQIICFNAHTDKFEEVQLPEPRGEEGDIICGLGVLDGCLCMSRSGCPGNSESNVEVLIMKEYGVKNSWAIRFVISHGFTFNHYDMLVPLGYTKNGEVITEVYVDYGWHIRAFNMTDNSHRRISIAEDGWHIRALNMTNNSRRRISTAGEDIYFRTVAHEESSITPPDYDWEEEERKGEATYVEQRYHKYPLKMKKGKEPRMVTGPRNT
ncbi:F-box/kelch-repeat protein At3g23880-like [Rhododendron vialii]|uniref:F-box/kelch-repeat protein At3g23880-like n=1 Tax=Rhododendron vialii TaxID=182163 RepID=UPI00265F8E9F|nr:F-box/kelch-repeat protein At3g23880-like [Rhododendron vialii]